MTSRRRAVAGCLVALTVAVGAAVPEFAASSAAAGATARASSRCSPPKYPGHGYFSSLSVSGTSCSTGRQLVLAFYHCRLKHGAAGRCRSTVLGFTCSERRQSIPTELDARVTCHRHSATVTHTYQQDL